MTISVIFLPYSVDDSTIYDSTESEAEGLYVPHNIICSTLMIVYISQHAVDETLTNYLSQGDTSNSQYSMDEGNSLL